mmetsp:Transcript_17841/g.52828  ORF Transcript_17841/g.52828 Transcript_17841/m.52828 type:complete len:255 (+) Transcript_17841:333-1097(+)
MRRWLCLWQGACEYGRHVTVFTSIYTQDADARADRQTGAVSRHSGGDCRRGYDSDAGLDHGEAAAAERGAGGAGEGWCRGGGGGASDGAASTLGPAQPLELLDEELLSPRQLQDRLALLHEGARLERRGQQLGWLSDHRGEALPGTCGGRRDVLLSDGGPHAGRQVTARWILKRRGPLQPRGAPRLAVWLGRLRLDPEGLEYRVQLFLRGLGVGDAALERRRTDRQRGREGPRSRARARLWLMGVCRWRHLSSP